MYEGYISRLIVARYLAMLHVRHECVLLPFVSVARLSFWHLYAGQAILKLIVT